MGLILHKEFASNPGHGNRYSIAIVADICYQFNDIIISRTEFNKLCNSITINMLFTKEANGGSIFKWH